MQLLPHLGRDLAFFFTDGVGIDGGSSDIGMAEPFLHHIERYFVGDASNTEAVP